MTEFQPGRGYSKEDWDEVSDNPEWTAADFAKARPFAEVFPEMAAAIKRGRGKQKAPRKQLTAIRLDAETWRHSARLGPAGRAGLEKS